ncbi:MAG: class B sortase [Clostridia bacterium]|nr:class B sortase [Clostridia bacterium]
MKVNKYMKVFFFILLVAIIVASSYYILSNLLQEKKQEDDFEDIKEIVIDTSEENQEEAEDKIDLYNLYLMNNDVVGWIKLKDSNIDYPIMQNGEYYLRRNIYKEYSSYGTPFLAEYCNINTSDNLIIYGHHIKSGMMFADLDKYKNYNYYLNHKIIKLYKLQGTETIEEEYKVVFCFKTTVNKGGFKYYNFYNATSEADYNSFVEQCQKLSFYNTEESASYGDRLITLSTCEYSLNNGRMVVVAKKI